MISGEQKIKTTNVDQGALKILRNSKDCLSRHQYKTLRGQILAGDPDGAMKGLRKLLQRNNGRARRYFPQRADRQIERSKT